MIEMKTFAFDKIVFKVIQGESPADRVSFVTSGDTKIHRRDSLIYAYSLLPRHLTCVHIAYCIQRQKLQILDSYMTFSSCNPQGDRSSLCFAALT
jgi:hypothetical protein